MTDFSLLFGVKSQSAFCNFVAMATAQNVTNWFYLQKVYKRRIFKVRKFQLDSLSRFRMVNEKQEGAYFVPPPPGKIGLRFQEGKDNHPPLWPDMYAEMAGLSYG